VPHVFKLLRGIGAVAAGLACLFGPALLISRPLLERMQTARAAAATAELVRASQLQYLPWAGGRTVYVIQGNNGRQTHLHNRSQYGWDFGLRYGEPVLSGIAGVVVSARDGCAPTKSWGCNDGYGNTVAMRVGDGTCARFMHLIAVAVAVDQAVLIGARIGTTGSSGSSYGYHLHYQREDCDTGRSLPSSFLETDPPVEGMYVTSALPAG
jgi:murein DD-endopeptidase MepM/ murein hydrolase activator NlpD